MEFVSFCGVTTQLLFLITVIISKVYEQSLKIFNHLSRSFTPFFNTKIFQSFDFSSGKQWIVEIFSPVPFIARKPEELFSLRYACDVIP